MLDLLKSKIIALTTLPDYTYTDDCGGLTRSTRSMKTKIKIVKQLQIGQEILKYKLHKNYSKMKHVLVHTITSIQF